MKTSPRLIFVFLFIAFISVSPVFSATWDGGGADNLASTPANWTGNVLPPSGDSIIFNATSSKDCTWDLNETYVALAIDGDAGAVTIDSPLTLSGNYVPPDAPSGLNAVAISSSRIDLSWTDNSSTETGFKLERKTGVTGTYNQIGTAGLNETAYSDTDPSLTMATTYYYQVRAYDIFSDSFYSNEANATTLAIAPSATTNPASNNVGTTAALNATVNPNGEETTVSFEWGIDTSYGNTSTEQIISSGTTDVAVSTDINGLSPNTPYHYRVKAVNAIGTTYGADVPFTTPIIAPSAITNPVSNNTTGNSATLNGSINPNGAATSVYFQWGTDTSYGNTTTTQNIPAGVNNVDVAANISGLTLNTTYHYRVVATNPAGTTYGEDVIFTTPSDAPPFAWTEPATNKNGNSATLNATVNPNGLQTSAYFEWGTTASYGNTTTPSLSLPADYDDVYVESNITGLSINTTYHYRVVATNTDGTTYGSDMMFTTPQITIAITSPADGGTINRPDIMVTGNLVTTTGNETGVTANGIVGMVYSNQFVVNHVPLEDGANTISVTATDTAGNTATTAIAVTANTLYPHVRLTANTESGVSPFTVNFTASTSIPNAVTTYKIDYDGNGTDDYTGSTFTNINHTYSSPGSYYAKLTVVDNAQTSYTDTIAIVVVNGDTLDGALRNIWNSMKGKLTNNDPVGASGYYSSASKNKYLSTFSMLTGYLPEISANMQDISLNYMGSDTAEYRIIRNELVNGQSTDVMYLIYFVKDEDGLWKIQGF